jgi:RNA polymerase sigma-70 factor (ECF subfamily)
MKVMQRREQLRDHERFGPWIFRIARNLAFNEMRKSRRKARVWILSNLAWEGEESECLFDRIPHPAQNPLERTIDGERRRIIQQAIAELDALTQEMLQLRYFEQFSLVEIAEALHVPLGTVCTKIHRGLKAVQRKLKGQGIHALDEI